MPDSMDIARLDVTPSGGGVGAFVNDIDLRTVGAGEAAAIRLALGRHGVLFFREQALDPDAQIAFARKIGEININRFFRPTDTHPEVATVLKEPHQKNNIGGGWHADHSYDAAPALGSILVAVETPPHGGDTLFAGTCAAWETLSDGMKRMLSGLRAVHSSRHVFGKEAAAANAAVQAEHYGNPELATQDSVHPVVIRHPTSGRPSLYVNPGFTLRFDGWTDAESKPLLDWLYAHVTRPEHTYRFRWEPGSVAFWDNRATWHYALNDYHGHRRLMHRITLEGEVLEPVSSRVSKGAPAA